MLGRLLLTIAIVALFHGKNNHRFFCCVTRGTYPFFTAAFSTYERMALPTMSPLLPYKINLTI